MTLQGRIQEFAKGGPVPPVPFLSFSSLPFLAFYSPSPLEVGPLKPTRSLVERCEVRGGAPAENELNFGAL